MKNRGINGRKALIILRDLVILCLIGNGITFLTDPEIQWDLRIVLINCFFSISIGFPAWRGSVYYTNLLEKRVPWLEKPIKRLLYQTIGLLFFAAAIVLIAVVVFVLISDEINLQNMRFNAVRSLKLITIFMLISIVLTNAVLFFINWRNAVIQQEELKRAHLTLQYQSLKSQIRPHFLFNSLSSLVTLIQKDPGKATQFVHRLSDVYRYVLEQSDRELVPLSEEVKFMEDYVYLQQIRFGENLRVKLDLQASNGMLVPLSLQMTVENALKHNEISAEHPLIIEISMLNGQSLEIRNRIHRKVVLEQSTGTGLENLSRRIAFFSDERLEYGETDGWFTVRLPIMQP